MSVIHLIIASLLMILIFCSFVSLPHDYLWLPFKNIVEVTFYSHDDLRQY